jgi:hypothetical protein
VGLKGWEDIIVQDNEENIFTVPSVPLARKFLEGCALRRDIPMETDARFAGRIKWYVKPIAFGGDPNPGENVTWVTHEQHGELVVWWNRKYNEVSGKRDA